MLKKILTGRNLFRKLAVEGVRFFCYLSGEKNVTISCPDEILYPSGNFNFFG